MRTIEGSFYLVLSRKHNSNWKLAARLTSGSPRLASGEVAVALSVSLPESLFQRPQLSATVVVPPSDVSNMDISAEVMDNVAQVLSEQLGMVVRVSVEDTP